MAINPVAARSPAQHKDAMDKLLQGLQIANEVFKIPVGFEQLQKSRDERQLVADQREGKYTVGEAAKAGLEFEPDKSQPVQMSAPPEPALFDQLTGAPPRMVPVPVNMTPEQQQSALTTPERFSKLQKYPGSLVGPGGGLIPGSFVSKEAKKEAIGQEEGLRKEYGQQEPITVLKQAQQNYGNIVNGLGSGNKEGQTLALLNIARLYNPGVQRVGDIQAAESVPDIIKKGIARLTGKEGNIVLQKSEVANYKALADQAMANYVDKAQETITRYQGLAKDSGFLPQNIGIEDYSKYKGGQGDQHAASPGLAVGKTKTPKFFEGQTATNPQTGERVTYKGGQWIPVK